MSGVAAEAPLTVLYDDSCGLCRRLAEYGRGRSEGRLVFLAWQDYRGTDEARHFFDASELSAPPTRLRAIVADNILEDREAWAAILAAYPPFEKLAWIAERLGFMGTVSHATYYGAQWLRQRCRECP